MQRSIWKINKRFPPLVIDSVIDMKEEVDDEKYLNYSSFIQIVLIVSFGYASVAACEGQNVPYRTKCTLLDKIVADIAAENLTCCRFFFC